MAQHPELEPSLVETFIGEVDEHDADGSNGEMLEKIISMVSDHPDAPSGTRSISDRYSYRAAIYSSNKNDNGLWILRFKKVCKYAVL